MVSSFLDTFGEIFPAFCRFMLGLSRIFAAFAETIADIVSLP